MENIHAIATALEFAWMLSMNLNYHHIFLVNLRKNTSMCIRPVCTFWHEFREAVANSHLFLPRPEAESSSSVGGAAGGGARVCLTRAVTHAAEGERTIAAVGRGGIISGHHAGKPPHLICKRNPLGKGPYTYDVHTEGGGGLAKKQMIVLL